MKSLTPAWIASMTSNSCPKALQTNILEFLSTLKINSIHSIHSIRKTYITFKQLEFYQLF
jgi:hypothetical protein